MTDLSPCAVTNSAMLLRRSYQAVETTMTGFARELIVHPALKHLFIGDPESGLLHQRECPACPDNGVPFCDRQAALTRGYTCCNCAVQALIAPIERIRALLATMPVKR